MRAIVSQHIHIPNHHDVHFKCLTILLVNCTLIKLVGKKKRHKNSVENHEAPVIIQIVTTNTALHCKPTLLAGYRSRTGNGQNALLTHVSQSMWKSPRTTLQSAKRTQESTGLNCHRPKMAQYTYQ